MSQTKSIVALLALCLVALVSSAPTEPEASSTAASATTTAASATTTAAASSAQQPSDKDATSTTASMAVSSAQDHAHISNTTFTCYNRQVGYYADIEAECKVYHFCMLGDYNGQEVYQRVSYLCLNQTVFDQQALDCVDVAKVTAACGESAKFYDESNSILRKAIIGTQTVESQHGETNNVTTAELASTTAPDASTTTPTTTTAAAAAEASSSAAPSSA